MYYRVLIIWLILNLCKKSILASGVTERAPPVQRSGSQTNILAYTENQLHAFDSCSYDDFACLSMAASDKNGLDAIMTLHKQLDDDEDGTIDFEESDDFLKEELKYENGAEKRQKAFHRNNDMHISVKELWESWIKSEVHNWTVEQTTDWLSNNVHLPQYVPNFVQHKVKGANLPRLAVNNGNFLAILGIKDPIHKQKISLKAMDVVLFGPPKDGITWKDITLILSAIVVILGSWLAYQQNKKFKNHLNRMNRDMDSLQNSEQALEKLQKQLEQAKEAENAAISEKRNLERSLTSGYSESDVTHYKEEIKQLKMQLEQTQAAFKNSLYLPSPRLQQLLQLTYEMEQRSYDRKKVAAEKQLQQAKEACEKLRKKRSSVIGAFVSTHGKAIDDVDRSIMEARSSLNEVTYELQEKSRRWREIEALFGFPISVNPGMTMLETSLYKEGRLNGIGARMNSIDDLDNDDTGSVYGLGSTSYPMASLNEDDTSGSETGKQDENANDSRQSEPHFSFQIGGATYPDELGSKLTTKSVSQSNISMKPVKITRSVTQDINVEELAKAKACSSESSLDAKKLTTSIEDDIGSTDSSLIEDDGKKKKRKLFNFTKKSKKS